MNKKLLLLICLTFGILISVNAQTSYFCEHYGIFADAAGIQFCYNDSISNYMELRLEEENPSMPGYYGYIPVDFKMTFDYLNMMGSTVYGWPWYPQSPSYYLTDGRRYRVAYKLPSDFHFYYYCHNPYQYIKVFLYWRDHLDQPQKLELATIPFNKTLYVGQYWYCSGTDGLSDNIHYSDWVTFNESWHGSGYCVGISFMEYNIE